MGIKLFGWLPAAGIALLLVGCSGDPSSVTTEGREVVLPDGRTVVCVVAVEGSAGSTGVSCDWDGVRR